MQPSALSPSRTFRQPLPHSSIRHWKMQGGTTFPLVLLQGGPLCPQSQLWVPTCLCLPSPPGQGADCPLRRPTRRPMASASAQQSPQPRVCPPAGRPLPSGPPSCGSASDVCSTATQSHTVWGALRLPHTPSAPAAFTASFPFLTGDLLRALDFGNCLCISDSHIYM